MSDLKTIKIPNPQNPDEIITLSPTGEIYDFNKDKKAGYKLRDLLAKNSRKQRQLAKL
jgi:hypothetical protein